MQNFSPTAPSRQVLLEGRYALRCEYEGILRDTDGKILTVSAAVAREISTVRLRLVGPIGGAK